MSPTLRLYNTLTRTKEVFTPVDPKNVRMYVCGPTVYDYAHIGNARPVIVFDVLYRLLRHLYGETHVRYARNLTDVDDKINARAARDFPDLPLNQAIAKVTEATTAQFHADVDALGNLRPDDEPRATGHIGQMQAIIHRLIARGVAYVAEQHVLFHVPAVAGLKDAPKYGSLARRSLDEMVAGARVDVAPYKRDPMDFVLWKPSREGVDPGWDWPDGAPEGITVPGRPGWHIECSAMSMAKLLTPFGGGLQCDDPARNVFDIHGGGIDLVFPHHENELTQSCCAFGGAEGAPRMANYWMHNGFLQVEGEKMSKSLGNFVTINELLQKWPGDVLRMQMLQTHYRQPIDWTETKSDLARMEFEDWADVIRGYANSPPAEPPTELVEALLDDLNTPQAFFELRRSYEKARNGGMDERRVFAAACRLLGFRHIGKPGLFRRGTAGVNVGRDRLFQNADNVERLRAAIANGFDQSMIVSEIEATGVSVETREDGEITLQGQTGDWEAKVKQLVSNRLAARKAKNFAESDRIRDELAAMGIALKDGKDPATGEPVTNWEVKR